MIPSVDRTGLPRFLAYDGANGRMVMTDMNARQILNHIRDHLWPTVDDRSVEILDCGPGGVGVDAVTSSVEEARKRFPAVFRGPDVPGLAQIALPSAL